MRIGGAGSSDKLPFAGIGTAKAEVLFDSAVEQVSILGDYGDHSPHCIGIERPQVLPPDAYRAALWVMQA